MVYPVIVGFQLRGDLVYHPWEYPCINPCINLSSIDLSPEIPGVYKLK